MLNRLIHFAGSGVGTAPLLAALPWPGPRLDAIKSEDFLPRVLFNYRQSENLIFRGRYFLSVARPQIGDLSSQGSDQLHQRPDVGARRSQAGAIGQFRQSGLCSVLPYGRVFLQ